MERVAEVLSALQERRYRFLRFEEAADTDGCVFLRHDVDLSLGHALRLADLEADLGVTATFFFLVRSGLYNLLSREGRATVARIADLGHGVGLHFDATFYDEPGPDDVAAELAVVAGFVPGCSEIISLHRPPEGLDAIHALAARLGRRTTYDPTWTRDVVYRSDSSGQTRRVIDTVAELAPRRANLQLLLHPFWWVGAGAGSGSAIEAEISTRLEDFALAAAEDRLRTVRREVMPTAPALTDPRLR